MENQVREILTAPAREDSWQSFVVILLEALQHGEPHPTLADPLKELIRDSTRWPRIRDRAVDVFVQHRRNDTQALTELKELTADVYAGRVARFRRRSARPPAVHDLPGSDIGNGGHTISQGPAKTQPQPPNTTISGPDNFPRDRHEASSPCSSTKSSNAMTICSRMRGRADFPLSPFAGCPRTCWPVSSAIGG